MCMEDIRIARKAAAGFVTTTLPAGVATIVLPADDNRINICFSTQAVGITVFPRSLVLTAATGFSVVAGNIPFVFTIAEWAKWITEDWFGFQTAGAGVITAFYTSLAEQ
jgi:hypothetical protein